MRNRKLWVALAGWTVFAISAGCATPARVQTAEVKEKPPMYSYIAVWNIPRDQWEARENQAAAARKILERAVADGTIAAYGFDRNPLHDTFWLSMSREVHWPGPASGSTVSITQSPGAPLVAALRAPWSASW